MILSRLFDTINIVKGKLFICHILDSMIKMMRYSLFIFSFYQQLTREVDYREIWACTDYFLVGQHRKKLYWLAILFYHPAKECEHYNVLCWNLMNESFFVNFFQAHWEKFIENISFYLFYACPWHIDDDAIILRKCHIVVSRLQIWQF